MSTLLAYCVSSYDGRHEWVLSCDISDVIYNNTGEKLFTYRVNNVDYNFYNSAVFQGTVNGKPYFYPLLFTRTQATVGGCPLNTEKVSGIFSSQTYTYIPDTQIGDISNWGFGNDGQGLSYSWSAAQYSYVTEYSEFLADIPVFTDPDEFVNYTTHPYVPSITVIQARFAEYYYRLRVNTTGNLVYDNSDGNKYINQTISGGPGGNYNFYNSATLFYNLSGRNGIATSIICDAPYSWVWEYSTDNTNWSTAQGPVSSSLNQNGVYAVSYDVGSESDSGNIVYMFFNAFKFGNDNNWAIWDITDSLIPIFNNDVNAYQNYITNVYVPVTIKVSYIIPDDEYTYCNLTWKKDYEPEDKNDGYTTTLLKDESVINVTGLEENSKYVFKIFTSKSESPPFIYECGIRKKVKLSDLIPDDINTRHVEIFTTTSSAWDSAYQYANNNPNDLVIYRHSSSHPDNRYDKETNSYDIQDIQEWSDYFIFYPLKHPITVYGGEQKITFNPNSHYHAYDWGYIGIGVFDYDKDKEELTGSASCYNGATDQFSVGETRTIKKDLEEPIYTKHVVFRSNYGNWTINDIYLTIKG